MNSNNFINQANSMVPKLRNKESDDSVKNIKEMNSFDVLRSTLFSFFENILAKVQVEDDFKKRIKDALLEKIDTDNTVTFSQLVALLNNLNDDNQHTIDSILSIFKPAPGTGEVSPLINPKVKESNEISAFSGLSVSERESIDKLARVIQKIDEVNLSKNEEDN